MTSKDESLTSENNLGKDAQEPGVSRRKFLAAGTAVASALAFPTAAQAAGDGSGRGQGGGKAKGLKKRGDVGVEAIAKGLKKGYTRFSEPKVFAAGSTRTVGQDLHVRTASVTSAYFDSQGNQQSLTQTVRTYNGTVPGPTFSMNPGDALTLQVINELTPNTTIPGGPPSSYPTPPPYAADDCETLSAKNIPGCFNTTNLHTHGLHVSPRTKAGPSGDPKNADSISSDDVHVRIPPVGDTLDNQGWSSTRNYCVKLPDFHAPGTHWYHSHIHGSTAIQVVNGLVGAIIVEEPDDQKIPVDDEKLLIVQEIIGTTQTNPDTIIYGNIKDSAGGKPYGTASPSGEIAFTVNSLNTPTIEMTTGEIVRWRTINATATPRGYMDLMIGDINKNPIASGLVMSLIAVDGITFYGQSPQPVPAAGHFMAPANRADFLVQFSQPGTYYLWKRQTTIKGGGPNPTKDQILAIINVTGDPVVAPKPLPPLPGTDKRPCYLAPITNDEIVNSSQSFTFNVQGGTFGNYTINNQAYGQVDGSGDPLPPPNYNVALGTAEEWTLINNSGAAHPFHIHVNPFQVLQVTDPAGVRTFGPVTPDQAVWWDTFSIPPNGGTVKIRSRFPTYSGKFVFHCHILIHEDSGMMWDVTVNGDGAEPCEAVSQDQCKEAVTLPGQV